MLQIVEKYTSFILLSNLPLNILVFMFFDSQTNEQPFQVVCYVNINCTSNFL